MMKTKYFEDYLQDKHAAQYVGLDDEMPDDFNEWLQELDADEWILYAEKYALIKMLEIKMLEIKGE